MKTFRAVEHRLEFVAEIGGVSYYNDSKATNVDAALKAIEAFPGSLIVILGGKDKGSIYAGLRESLRKRARLGDVDWSGRRKNRGRSWRRGQRRTCGNDGTRGRNAAERAAPGDVVLTRSGLFEFRSV